MTARISRVATTLLGTATVLITSAVVAPAAFGAPLPTPTPSGSPASIQIELPGTDQPSTSIIVLLGLTLLSVAPAALLLTTSFTKIIVVLSLTRNALGLQSVPPNQVLAGLAMFLSLFIMAPVVSQINTQAVQPYLDGAITVNQAYDVGVEPLRTFMLEHTRQDELQLMIKLSKSDQPANEKDVSMTTLVPAFVLSELRAAFIIGFVIFLPFLIIDMVVSGLLMAIGTMMLPPVMISLPFKLLLFVLVDGWGLVVTALVTSYQ